ncbi:MAG TPA: hypothetical protein ENN30_02705 [Candidatus Woesearchaeota archaeon]|nr:hypothetical protein [Candidatus Woesearchaeota archaeon]
MADEFDNRLYGENLELALGAISSIEDVRTKHAYGNDKKAVMKLYQTAEMLNGGLGIYGVTKDGRTVIERDENGNATKLGSLEALVDSAVKDIKNTAGATYGEEIVANFKNYIEGEKGSLDPLALYSIIKNIAKNAGVKIQENTEFSKKQKEISEKIAAIMEDTITNEDLEAYVSEIISKREPDMTEKRKQALIEVYAAHKDVLKGVLGKHLVKGMSKVYEEHKQEMETEMDGYVTEMSSVPEGPGAGTKLYEKMVYIIQAIKMVNSEKEKEKKQRGQREE